MYYSVWRSAKFFHFLILVLVCSQVKAVDMDYQLNYILAKHNNINLVSNPTGEEWLSTLTGVLNVVENSTNLVANLNVSTSILNYKNDQSQNSTFSNLNLNTLWIVNPNRFEWLLSDVYTQMLIDPRESDTQSNRQNTNVFTTGPNYYWRLSSRHNINLEARYQNLHLDFTNGDSDRISTELAWVFQVNSSLAASLNTIFATLDYKDNTQSDYTNSDVFIRVAHERGRTNFVVEAGISNFDFETQDNIYGQRYLISLQNQRTTNSDVLFAYSHSISDEATELSSAAQDTTSGTTLPTSLGVDVFTEDNLNIRYNNVSNTLSFLAELEDIKRDYVVQNELDIHSFRASIQPTYNFSQTSSLNLEAMRTKTTYDNSSPERQDVDTTYILRYNDNIGRNIRWSLSLESEQRKSSVSSNNYLDNRVLLTLSYISR